MALATRWHGTTSREPPVYSGEAGTRKRREFGAPSLPASRAKEQPGTSKAGWGLPGVCWKGILAPLPRPGLARAGRAAPNNSGVWGGKRLPYPGRGGTGRAGFTSSPGTQQAPRPHEDRWAGAIPAAARPCRSRDEAGPSPSSQVTSWPGSCCSAPRSHSHNHSLKPCWAEP